MATHKAIDHLVLGPVHVRAVVQDGDVVGAVGDGVLELRVVNRVVLRATGHPPVLRVDRGAARDHPRHQDAVDLQPKVVVVAARRMMLDHELWPAIASSSASRLLGTSPRPPRSPVIAQTHDWVRTRPPSPGKLPIGCDRRYGPTRQCSMRWWSGVNPCLTPHKTAWVRLPTQSFR